jgi:hypothetical protein
MKLVISVLVFGFLAWLERYIDTIDWDVHVCRRRRRRGE